ncbi:hypothetical protein SLEP1_g58535 [Rubroshorea leprosula]|uniref:BZIP domain-containing protein n=1 Tax=Rubroshorea leprosula TaxID=152421 RepID=A0AAV5MPL4_9ROSI|nr:hypothetical protein SLEP1_g58535 [Rubroshorea leprosula]
MDHPNQEGDQDEQSPALLDQDGQDFLDELVSQLLADDVPDSFWDEVGHGALTAPGAPDFAYNEIQTLSNHDKELNEQQCDQLIVDTLELLQPSMMLLGPPDASYSMDEFSPLPASSTQLPENQMPAGIQPLIQEQLDPAAEKELKRRESKRACDRAYRQRKKEKELKLIDENEVNGRLLNALRAQIQTLGDQLQKAQQQVEKNTKVEAEKEYWKKQYLLLSESSKKNSRKENQLLPKVKAMRKQICLYQKNLGKLWIKKRKKKLKKQVMMVESAEETKNDN